MQVLALNPNNCPLYLHVQSITSPLLRQKFGDYSINFWEHPCSQQAPDSTVFQAVTNLINNPKYQDWQFQVL